MKVINQLLWVFVGMLIMFALIVLFLPEKETFNPDEHVCLEWECKGCDKLLEESYLTEEGQCRCENKRGDTYWSIELEKLCKSWRPKTPCEKDPNGENCECDEWDGLNLKEIKQRTSLYAYQHTNLWDRHDGIDWWHGELYDISILEIKEPYECAINCPNKNSFEGCQISTCYRDLPKNCLEIDLTLEELRNTCDAEINILFNTTWIKEKNCLKAHLKEGGD